MSCQDVATVLAAEPSHCRGDVSTAVPSNDQSIWLRLRLLLTVVVIVVELACRDRLKDAWLSAGLSDVRAPADAETTVTRNSGA